MMKKLKDRLQRDYEILDCLASKDKKELKKAGYVAYDDVIEFPKPIAFSLKRLKAIIKEIEKAKLRGNDVLYGGIIQIPIPDDLKEKFLDRQHIKLKSIKKNYNKIK